jgi:hypothetical protein
MKVLCTFTPQTTTTRGKYIIDVDPPEGCEPSWEDEAPDDMEVPQSDTYDTDYFRNSTKAPKWVQQWPGPFRIAIEAVPNAGGGVQG